MPTKILHEYSNKRQPNMGDAAVNVLNTVLSLCDEDHSTRSRGITLITVHNLVEVNYQHQPIFHDRGSYRIMAIKIKRRFNYFYDFIEINFIF